MQGSLPHDLLSACRADGSGVIFLWKGFYGEYGMINQVLNFFVSLVNYLPGVDIAEIHIKWLNSPRFALFFCLFY